MMTEDYSGIELPMWFLEKYPQYHYSWNTYRPLLSIASRSERKFYGEFKDEELFQDIQKVLTEVEYAYFLSVVLLHECGGITLVLVSREKILGREPLTWKEVEYVEHNYCNGCSEPKTGDTDKTTTNPGVQ